MLPFRLELTKGPFNLPATFPELTKGPYNLPAAFRVTSDISSYQRLFKSSATFQVTSDTSAYHQPTTDSDSARHSLVLLGYIYIGATLAQLHRHPPMLHPSSNQLVSPSLAKESPV
jgi:hypothetical protein